jgi:2-polyprenyl-3-methyl-5-hydroxy-6-metoxy-1,4-benzoquinol methylase
MFDPKKQYLGNFTPNDGTIDFYLRVNSLLKPEFTVLDLGGGRGEWMEDDCNIRKSLRLIKGKVKKVIAADIDPIVMQNKSADEYLIIDNNFENLPSNSYDLIICDWVLEHIEQPQIFFNNIKRILKHGGFFCARTPHKYSYWAIANRLVPEKIALQILKYAQPFRQAKDIFSTFYYLNTMQHIIDILQVID